MHFSFWYFLKYALILHVFKGSHSSWRRASSGDAARRAASIAEASVVQENFEVNLTEGNERPRHVSTSVPTAPLVTCEPSTSTQQTEAGESSILTLPGLVS